jgi:hypothetical protein
MSALPNRSDITEKLRNNTIQALRAIYKENGGGPLATLLIFWIGDYPQITREKSRRANFIADRLLERARHNSDGASATMITQLIGTYTQ